MGGFGEKEQQHIRMSNAYSFEKRTHTHSCKNLNIVLLERDTAKRGEEEDESGEETGGGRGERRGG